MNLTTKQIVTGLVLLISSLTVGVVHAALGPHELVKQTTDRLLSAIERERATIEQNPSRIFELVEEIALPHFDFRVISRRVLGKEQWESATLEQRERFEREFARMLIRTYATALKEYTGQAVKMEPLEMKPGDRKVRVRAEVEQPGSYPIPIDYWMYEKNGVWRVYDVAIDEISLVANYRTTFANEIRNGGLEKLIATLESRNRAGATDK
ncbi:MAG: ABC transporter substrate-binding protein [Gammaproteobacteria bacterium]